MSLKRAKNKANRKKAAKKAKVNAKIQIQKSAITNLADKVVDAGIERDEKVLHYIFDKGASPCLIAHIYGEKPSGEDKGISDFLLSMEPLKLVDYFIEEMDDNEDMEFAIYEYANEIKARNNEALFSIDHLEPEAWLLDNVALIHR